MMKKSVALFVFVAAVACAAALPCALAAEDPLQVTGTVVIVNPDLRNMTVQENSGALIPLIVGPQVDLTACREGDRVTLECNIHGVALSLTSVARK